MEPINRRRLCLGTLAATLLPGAALGQEPPRGNLRVIVPFPAGASVDAVGRLVAQQLAARLQRPVMVENRAGANTIIGTEALVQSPADGNTILVTISSHASNVAVYRKLPYDTRLDFAAVAMIGTTPSLIAVHPSLQAGNLRELLALSRSTPQGISYGTAGHGSTPHLAGELLNSRAASRLIHVPYKGGAPALNDVIAGHIPVIIGGLPTIAPSVQANRLRGIAVTTIERSPVLPDIPTVAESGFPGFDAGIWYALVAHGRTPRPVIQKLHAAMADALSDPAFRRQLQAIGVEPGGGTTAEIDAFIAREIDQWSALVQKTGLSRID